MIIDSSALIAMVQREPAAPALADVVGRALGTGEQIAVSAATFVEAAIVADGPRDPVRTARFDGIFQSLNAEVVPLTAAQAAIARQAYRDYGKGSGHPARLNLGDCFAYALAKGRGEPLLYVGDDFARTDIASALS
ncbi:type II toxin-antitoxin system VapC family toxin [Microbacterium sp.]|uniref:type II toxin-antitoxin system VapC family toxin n=1 Tax=Microbacterium sp. TaxID=51671 RepID=UPI003C70C0BC